MIKNQLDLRINDLQREITANAREVVRLQDIIADETRQLLKLQAERDETSGLKVSVMDQEIQKTTSFTRSGF